jgi:hypothetical protein
VGEFDMTCEVALSFVGDGLTDEKYEEAFSTVSLNMLSMMFSEIFTVSAETIPPGKFYQEKIQIRRYQYHRRNLYDIVEV